MEPSKKTAMSYLRAQEQRQPQRIHLQTETKGYTFHDSVMMIRQTAGRLASFGIGEGTMAVLQTRRDPLTVYLIMALWSLGAIAALTDPRDDLQELGKAVNAPVLLRRVGDDVLLYRMGEEQPCSLTELAPVLYTEKTDSTLPAAVIFTSGSTGTKKPVLLSEYAILNNLTAAEESGDYRPDDMALGVLPLDHIFGQVLLAGSLVHGYGLMFPETLSPEHLLSCVERFRVTRMNAVPALYLAMAEKAEGYDLSTLRVGFIGGAACRAAQFSFIEERLGMTLLSAYGMSECVSITLTSHNDPAALRSCSVGRAYPMTELRILSEEGSALPAGAEGEIAVKAPSLMLCYYGDEAATAEALTADGFLRTGDLGVLDENGCLYITGRKKLLIIRNGINLSPRCIEEAAERVCGVDRAAVVGLFDDREGEVPALLYQGKAEPDMLTESLSKLLPKNAMPVRILQGKIPCTPNGKTDLSAVKAFLVH